MKTATDYKSVAEIHADPELNIFQRGRAVEAWTALHAGDTPPLPVPDEGERATLRELRASLAASRADWLALETREKRFEAILSETPLPAVDPDAPAEQILAFLVVEKRIQIIRGFLASASATRTNINGRCAAAFHALNRLVQRFSAERFPKQFFITGTEPVTTITDALATIERFLKK